MHGFGSLGTNGLGTSRYLSAKMIEDSAMHGISVVKTGIRKWYNPLRYIKGLIYAKRISLRDVYKEDM